MSTRQYLLDCGFTESGAGVLCKKHFDMTFTAYPAPEYTRTWRQGTWRCEVKLNDKVIEIFESTRPDELLDFFDRAILTVA